LEEVGVRLAAMRKTLKPHLGQGAVVVCAADHGVVAEGVSAYPAEVTAQMVRNFRAGGAAINQMARVADAKVFVLDVGVKGLEAASTHSRKVRAGTGNIALEPAMTLTEAEQALQAGADMARQAIAQGATLLAAGDMGIGNTTAALTAALLGLEAEAVTGRGTGVDEARYQRKLEVVRTALERAQARLGELPQADPLALLAELGGWRSRPSPGSSWRGPRPACPW
jgi:nicotinate-nucleotide--dimethylbenzimidazole phosphoribosyltransferase